MKNSIIERLIKHFKEDIAYLNFIINVRNPFLKQVIYAALVSSVLLASGSSIYLLLTNNPPYIFFIPNTLALVIISWGITYLEKRKKKSLKIKSNEEFWEERREKLQAYLKENKLFKASIIKFLVTQISTVNKPAKLIPNLGFAVLFAMGIYYTDTLLNGLKLYSDLFSDNQNSSAEREFWLMLYTNTIVTAGVAMLYMVDRFRVKLQNYEHFQISELVQMLQDLYIKKKGG